MSAITPLDLLCMGALSYGSFRAVAWILTMLARSAHPRGCAHLALLMLIAMGGLLGLTSPRARRAAVALIGLCLMYISAEPVAAAMLAREPSIVATLCAWLPSLVGVTAIVFWACWWGCRAEDKWTPLGGILFAYGMLSAAAWLTVVVTDRAYELSALLRHLQQFQVRAAAYFAPLALGASCMIAGNWLITGPAGHALRFRATCLCAAGASLVGALPFLLVAYPLSLRVTSFLGNISPAIVTASLLAFCEYHGWRFAIKGACLVCGYNLAGNVSGRCPECGRSIDSPRSRAEG